MDEKPTYDDLKLRIQELGKEVSRLRLTEEALQQSEKKYRQLFVHAPAGIYEVDFEKGKFVEVNDLICEYMGYTREEFLAMNPFDILSEESKILFKERFEKTFRGEAISETFEYDIVTKNGRQFTVILNHNFIYEKGKLKGTVVVVHDITEEKKLEKRLKQAHKMEAIGTLSGGIAHEFNNMLGIILGNTELALDDIPEENPAHRNLKEIRTASLRAKNVVQQLLSFNRDTAKDKKPLNLTPVIKESVRLIQATLPSSINIKQNIRLAADTVLADPTQIRQIIINLCANAAHAMQQKGGVLEINTENMDLPHEEMNQYPDFTLGKYAKITVSDTGPGIAPEIKDRIFDPYFTIKEIGEGTGIGLSVVHGIVKSHDGTITIKSIPGQGTCFYIYLPVIEADDFNVVARSPNLKLVIP